MTHTHRSGRRLATSLGLVLALTPLLGTIDAHAATATGQVSVSPSTNLKDGSAVTVTFSGFPAGSNVVAVECSQANATSPAPCDTTNLGVGKADSAGKGSMSFTVHEGSIGNGTCDATHNGCVVYVSDNPQTTIGFGPIRFKTAAAGTPTPSATPKESADPSTGGGDDPVSVAAGSGGQADHVGAPWFAAGAVLVGLTGIVSGLRRARRGRS